MKFSHLSAVSALALAVAIGAPAYAQQAEEPAAAAPEATAPETPEAAAPDPDVDAAEVHGRMALDPFLDRLEEMGVEDRELFAGNVIRGTRNGEPVVMLIGPENFARGEVFDLDTEELEELRERLTDAGYEEVIQDHEWFFAQGTLEDYEVFASTGEADWHDAADPGTADPDRADFEDRLGDAAIEDLSEFEGMAMRGYTAEGESIFMLVGPEGFDGEESVELSADDMRDRFREAGLEQIEELDGIHVMRGTYEGYPVLAISGRDLRVDPVVTGAIPETEEDEVEAMDPDVEPDVDTPELAD